MLNAVKKNEAIDLDLECDLERDYRLRFFTLNELEIIRSAQNFNVELNDYCPRQEYSYLKDFYLNFEDLDLTNKQLIAICLVFYGGLTRKFAARIMKISSQALSDH